MTDTTTTDADLFVAINTDGDIAVSTDDADTAAQTLVDDYGPCAGVKVYQFKLVLPRPRVSVAEATIPETDGPVTVTVTA